MLAHIRCVVIFLVAARYELVLLYAYHTANCVTPVPLAVTAPKPLTTARAVLAAALILLRAG
jgi:hypothetical protein